jgi:hypothetical protein
MDSDSSEKPESPTQWSQTIDIDLQLTVNSETENELITNVADPNLIYNSHSEIILTPLINYLKSLGYPLENSMIWYFSPTAKLKVYCGNDPLPFSISIPMFELNNNCLQLICRGAIRNEFGTIVTLGSPSIGKIKQEEEAITNHKSSRRTKERKIGYIIEKVSKWRKLYNGVSTPKGEMIKVTLEEAANKIGISKKSLDDYLLQLRFGRKFGFNFQEHKDDKVGVLRAYVKKFKALHQYAKKIENGEPIPSDVIQKLQEPGTPACKHNRCCAPDFSIAYKQCDSQTIPVFTHNQYS